MLLCDIILLCGLMYRDVRYQEDAHTITTIHLPPTELRHSLQRFFDLTWDPGHIGDTLAGQMVFAGIYDG